MTVCSVCGHENLPGAEYCEGPSCGAYLPHHRAEDPGAGIAVELAVDAVSVTAGHQAGCGVRVEDLGGRGGRVALAVLGPLAAAAWPEPDVLHLPPGGHADGYVALRPGRDRLGRHVLRVRGSLLTDPAVTAEDTAGVVVVDEPPLALTEGVPPVPGTTSAGGRRRPVDSRPGGSGSTRKAARQGRGRRGAPLVALAAVVVTGAAAVGLALGRRTDLPDPPRQDDQPTRVEPLPVLGPPLVHDPPPGDGTENDHLVLAVLDGDPATTWRTEGYEHVSMVGKHGVGLFLRLPPGSRPRSLAVRSPTLGWDAQVYLTSGGGAGIPAHLAQRSPADGSWGEPVAEASGIAGDRQFPLDGREADGLLLWITRVVPESDGRLRTRLAEMACEGEVGSA